jgi:hypothetical protein
MIAAINRNKTGSDWLRKYRVWMHIAFWGLYYGFLLMYFWNIDMIGNSIFNTGASFPSIEMTEFIL